MLTKEAYPSGANRTVGCADVESLRPPSSVPIGMALVAEDLGLGGFRICEADYDAAIGLAS